jgi:hypothetical protein
MDTSESQDSKKSELPSQGTISIDFNDCSSSDQEVDPPSPPEKIIEGDSGPITIGPRKRFFQRDTSSQTSDSSSAESSREVGSLDKAFLEVGVWDGGTENGRRAPTCADLRRPAPTCADLRRLAPTGLGRFSKLKLITKFRIFQVC